MKYRSNIRAMLNHRLFTPVLLIAAYAASMDSAWAERQSLASIKLQAESFIAAYPYESPYPARFQLSALDPRLQLKPCASDLEIDFARADKVMGNTALSISCNQPVHWQIHLPVQVDIYDDVMVNRVPLVKGQFIDTKLVKPKKTKVSALFHGYFSEKVALTGLQAKRNLASNTVLTPANLAPRQLVASGQQVTILLNLKGLQVKSTGQALQSASMGQLVKVRNTQSNKIVEGVVTAHGQISVGQ